jgi:hypothetical protein
VKGMNCEEKLGLLEQQMHEMDQDINNYLDRINELEEENGAMAEKHADKDILLNHFEKALRGISELPKVRGIGNLENKYNNIIEMAKMVIRYK